LVRPIPPGEAGGLLLAEEPGRTSVSHALAKLDGAEPDAAAPAAAPAPAGLPCQNRNNSDKKPKRYQLRPIPSEPDLYRDNSNPNAFWRKIDGDLIERFGAPSGAEAKAAFWLRRNVEAFVQHYGRNHCLFFTLTDEKNLHPTQFARHWNNLLRRHGSWMNSFIRVLEPQMKGRPHYHVLTSVDWDTQPNRFDWDAFDACQDEVRQHGKTARFRSLRKSYRQSAAPELVEMWIVLRKILPRYGLGRAELLPMRRGHEAIAEYIGKYLEAGLVLRRHSWKGCRRMEMDRRNKSQWLACTRKFSWVSNGAKQWRERLGQFATAMKLSDYSELTAKLGRSWAYHLRSALSTDSQEDWDGWLELLREQSNRLNKFGLGSSHNLAMPPFAIRLPKFDLKLHTAELA